MSGPMGVPTQRLSQKPKASAGLRPTPIPIATTKLRTSKPKLPMASRAQSDIITESTSINASEAGEVSLARKVSKSSSKRAAEGTDSGGIVDKASRKIATNSRIKRNEQTKRDMYLAFVNNALKAKSEANPATYNELVSQFSTTSGPADYGQLRLWLLALSHVVSQLDKRHIALIEAIVHMAWTTSPDENFVKGYIGFIGMLVSARTEWLNLATASAVRRLTHRSPLNLIPPTQATSSSPVTYRTIFSRAHMLLQTLLSLFPTLPQSLPTHLLRCFPHKSHNTTSHTVYCRNLVEMMEYCPQVAESVLGLLVERAIGIDVEVQVELEELEELIASTNESATAVQNGLLSNLDPFDNLADDASSSDSESGSEAGDDVEIENFSDVSSEAEGGDDDVADKPGTDTISEKEANRRAKRLREMVAKLDSIMGLLLSWLHKTSPTNPVSDEATQHPHFATMMGIFDRTVLTTFKSRYTQFLIFYLVSLPSFPTLSTQGLDQELPKPVAQANPHADIFLGLLLHNTLIPQEPPIPMLTRIASASYLASFISRGLCVGKDECRGTVTVCCQWISEHLPGLELLISGKGDSTPTSQEVPQGSGYTELGVFYAVSQALFLIFCFRWRDLLESEKLEEEEEEYEEGHRRRWIRPLDIVQRLIISPLNPLKTCSPNVVHQFARISQKVGFVYCQSIIESNRRASKLALSSVTTPNTPGSTTPSLYAGGINPWDTLQSSAAMKDLQAFFPFDPYRLPNSKKWLDGMYREWSMVALDDDEEDDSDEEESENDQEGEDAQVGSESEADEVSHGLQQDDSDEDEKEDYVPMELGSVRDGLGMAESFRKMSISPNPGGIHRLMGKRRDA